MKPTEILVGRKVNSEIYGLRSSRLCRPGAALFAVTGLSYVGLGNVVGEAVDLRGQN
jgi:hypothetical protein